MHITTTPMGNEEQHWKALSSHLFGILSMAFILNIYTYVYIHVMHIKIDIYTHIYVYIYTYIYLISS